ncbi:inner membrane protein CreD [Ostertagia ostertagi]
MEPLVSTIWQRSKLLIKAMLIGVLTLALMIPAYFVENLISERQARQEEAFAEISGKWAGSQTLTGPVLVLPFLDKSIVNTGTRKLAYLLPENLVVKSTVSPEKRYRGIFEVMLYSSKINLSGKFNFEQLRQLKIDPADVLWQEAYTCMSIADPKGLKEDISMKWNDFSLTLAPTAVNNAIMREAYVSPVRNRARQRGELFVCY